MRASPSGNKVIDPSQSGEEACAQEHGQERSTDTSLFAALIPTDNEAGATQATIFSCVSNLTSTIIGAGVLGLPNAFASNGCACLYVLCVYVCVFALSLLTDAGVRL
jgi:hypothetical protein